MPKVTVLASRDELAAVRSVHALHRPGLHAGRGAELGATHVLRGTLRRSVEHLPDQPSLRLRTYHVSVEALSVADDRKAWAGSHAIKKVISTGGAALGAVPISTSIISISWKPKLVRGSPV